jgi:ribosomal protein S2
MDKLKRAELKAKRRRFFLNKRKKKNLIYSVLPLALIFSLSQLYRFYAFLGYNKEVTNFINIYYLYGFHNNISIINLYKMVNILRINFSLLIRVLLLKYGNVLLINENINKKLQSTLLENLEIYKVSYFFGN